jgi:hypothetical protein
MMTAISSARFAVMPVMDIETGVVLPAATAVVTGVTTHGYCERPDHTSTVSVMRVVVLVETV